MAPYVKTLITGSRVASLDGNCTWQGVEVLYLKIADRDDIAVWAAVDIGRQLHSDSHDICRRGTVIRNQQGRVVDSLKVRHQVLLLNQDGERPHGTSTRLLCAAQSSDDVNGCTRTLVHFKAGNDWSGQGQAEQGGAKSERGDMIAQCRQLS